MIEEELFGPTASEDKKARFSFVLEGIDIGVWFCDLPLSQLQWDARCKAHFGLPPEADVTIETFYDCIVEADRQPTSQALEAAIETGQVYDIVYRTRGPDGVLRWIRALGRASFKSDGTPYRFDGVTMDVSPQEAARDAARRADKMRSDFLANMSHELRTPLAGIHGLADLLLSTELQPAQREHLAVLKECTESLVAIVNDVLDLGRIGAGKLKLFERGFAIRPIVKGVMALFESQARERGLSLVSHVDDSVPEKTYGDPDRVRQILVNLLGNAIKFTHEGRVELRLLVQKETLIFEVSDTGIGIKEEDLKQLFQPFVQVHDRTREDYSGTGVGLSIVRHLTQLMGGKFGATSALGQGSLFWFTLAVKRLEAGSETPGWEPDELLDPGLRSARILVVEDNNVIRKVVSSQLTAVGLEVCVAERGTTALELAAGSEFQLILMDCQMPILDGYETTRLLRKQGFSGPILAVTANISEGERERCLAAGMSDYLSKPVSRDTLVDKVNAWLGSARPRD